MARQKATRESSEIDALPEVLEYRPALSIDEDTLVYYANFAEVGHTHAEVSVTYGRVPAKVSADQIEEIRNGGTLTVSSFVQILVPIVVVPGLISALQLHLDQCSAATAITKDLPS